MYVIKKVSDGSLSVHVNKRTDDIVKGMLEMQGLSDSDVQIYLCPETLCMKSCGPDGVITKVVDNAGVITVEEYESADWTDPQNPVYTNLLATHPTQLVSYASMYDGEGNFTAPAAI